jgi:hypothetical protein
MDKNKLKNLNGLGKMKKLKELNINENEIGFNFY